MKKVDIEFYEKVINHGDRRSKTIMFEAFQKEEKRLISLIDEISREVLKSGVNEDELINGLKDDLNQIRETLSLPWPI